MNKDFDGNVEKKQKFYRGIKYQHAWGGLNTSIHEGRYSMQANYHSMESPGVVIASWAMFAKQCSILIGVNKSRNANRR